MSKCIRLRPEVEAELEAAIEWYEACAPGLGSDFMRAVEASLASIERLPNRIRYGSPGTATALLYALIYSIEPGAIVVLACLHTRQSLDRWRRRVE